MRDEGTFGSEDTYTEDAPREKTHTDEGTDTEEDAYDNSIVKVYPDGKGKKKEEIVVDAESKFPRYISGYAGKNT